MKDNIISINSTRTKMYVTNDKSTKTSLILEDVNTNLMLLRLIPKNSIIQKDYT